MDEVTLPFVDNSPETVARKAAEMAAAVDRELALTQPEPELPPLRGEEKVPLRAGSVELPYFSLLNDPARVTGTHSRVMRRFRPRVVECVACEHKKLDTRLGDPQTHGLDPFELMPEERRHFGPGTRDYALCKSCYDTFGQLHPKVFDRYVAVRMREDQQRSLRGAKNFAEVAERVADVERWRRDVLAAREFGTALDASPLGERIRRRDGRYDGPNEDRVMSLSDFTDQRAADSAPRRVQPITYSKQMLPRPQVEKGARPQGRSRSGDADPMWDANDASYDTARIGADHAEAIIEDEKWEARRTEIFRRRLAGLDRIEDPEKRERARAALYRRWDPRLSPSERNPEKAEVTNPFAAVRKTLSPYPPTTLHSGVDEGYAAEPPHVRAAHARHLARVEAFLAEAPKKLARMGYDDAAIAELTSLPPLETQLLRRSRYPLDDPPLRKRLAAERAHRPQLPSAAELDQAAREGAVERDARATAQWAQETAAEIVAAETRLARTSADEFIDLAGRVHVKDCLVKEVRNADTAREHVSRWAHAIHRADQGLKVAADAFAREIKDTFQDPKAFVAAFKQLTLEEKRAMLNVLRERPEDFAREFRSVGGRDLGNAGRLAHGRRVPQHPRDPGYIISAVSEAERSGIFASEAGVRYLNAVTTRENVRTKAASALGVPETTSFDGLREACRDQMREANAKKAKAISERVTLGKVPSRRQLGAAFQGLTDPDRTRVLAELPEANARKAEMISERITAGKAPSRKQIGVAFSRLSEQDRTRVLREMPSVVHLLEPRGRALARTGLSL